MTEGATEGRVVNGQLGQGQRTVECHHRRRLQPSQAVVERGDPDRAELDAIWLSHLHADHTLDLVNAYYALSFGLLPKVAPIPVYAPAPIYEDPADLLRLERRERRRATHDAALEIVDQPRPPDARAAAGPAPPAAPA